MHTNENGRIILRTQLQIDVPPNLKWAIKELAVRQEISVRTLILLGLKAKYPELNPYLNSALDKNK